MKKSELITANRDAIAVLMACHYRSVLESAGNVQYKIYIWDDGVIESTEECQGDNAYLKPRDGELRKLFYITTVSAPCFYAFDYTDEPEPDDETEKEALRQQVIDYLVGEYAQTGVYDALDAIISEAQLDEQYELI